jgi:Protein of unknown function (DUF2721)
MSTLNPNFLSESIQLSVAPVFLLSAVAGMIGALTQRLGRIIDRSRSLQDEIQRQTDPEKHVMLKKIHEEELYTLSSRSKIVNISMGLLVLCAILIGLTILELFFAETISVSGQTTATNLVLYTFIGGITSFIISLIFLLWEVYVASYTVRMKPRSKNSMQF